MKPYPSPCIVTASVVVLSFSLLLGTIGCGSSISRELAAYEQSDDEKALANWLFRNPTLDAAELRQLAEWSVGHRWEFIKLVDHFSERKRSLFLASFPQQLRASPSYDEFTREFADSRSHTVQELLRRASGVSK